MHAQDDGRPDDNVAVTALTHSLNSECQPNINGNAWLLSSARRLRPPRFNCECHYSVWFIELDLNNRRDIDRFSVVAITQGMQAGSPT